MTREEHLQWCKDRAMEYVNRGDLLNAVTSMMSDLQKHPETADNGAGALGMLGIMAMMRAQECDLPFVTSYIKGFN